MKTYIVRKEDTVSYYYEVKANSAEEAEDKVLDEDHDTGDSDGTLHYLSESWSSGTKVTATQMEEDNENL